MSTIFLLIYNFFEKRKISFFISLSILLVLIGYFTFKISFKEDLSAFIPKDEKTAKINKIIQNLKFNDKLVVNIHLKDSLSESNPDVLIEFADVFTDTVQKQFYPLLIKEIKGRMPDDFIVEVYDNFYENLPIFLNDQDYKIIEQSIVDSSVKNRLADNYSSLMSPSGSALKKYLIKDPLAFTPLALKKLQGLQIDENFELYDGYVLSKDRKNLLLFISSAHTSNDATQSNQLIEGLDSTISRLTSSTNIAVEYFGPSAIAVSNAKQIKTDSITTSLLALVIILIGLGFYFRSLKTILMILLPVAFGGAFSLALIYLLQGEISAIAIGAGSVVLGIAMDYSIHFFTHYKHEKSVKNVINDLSIPLTIGCTTTVGAFLCLQYMQSQALKDMGLFAAFSLVGAALFCLIALPHLVKKEKNENAKMGYSFFDKIVQYEFHKNKILLALIIVFTFGFLFTFHKVGFETDMTKMSYVNPALQKAEDHLDQLNNYKLKSVYLVSSGKTLEQAMQRNELAISKIEALKRENIIKKYTNISEVLISDSLQQTRIAKWNLFWTEKRKEALKGTILKYGKEYKFKETAFADFFSQLDKKYEKAEIGKFDNIRKYFLDEYINEADGQFSIITQLKVEQQDKERVYASFANNDDMFVLDKGSMVSLFIKIINEDFNLILILCSVLVFGFLLLSYGRIELALLTFFPMVISWIWILGIMNLFDLKFNIINIIVCTFIFGLGDDYSIFTVDGLLQEYKSGKKTLASYRTSIFLSAFTTIVGIGVLIFAKHPALQSIALVTIIGISSIVLISLVVQPLIFNLFVLKRKVQGKMPFTFFTLCTTAFAFIYFLMGCLIIIIISFTVYQILPLSKEKKKYLFHYVISKFCKSLIYIMANVRKKVINNSGENFLKPGVIIANHQSFLDILITLMIYPKVILLTKDWVWNSPVFGRIVRMADFYPVSEGYEESIEKLSERVQNGYSIVVFPEGTRSETADIARFHKGAFYLAEQLKLDIIPILLHGTSYTMTRGDDFMLKNGRLTIKILPRIKFEDITYGASYSERTKTISQYFKSEYKLLRTEIEIPYYFREQLITNYIYKGPFTEWYARIKTKLEKDYTLFNSLIPRKGNVVDIGCGYGFLSYMLNFVSQERTVIGIDYDEEKIEVANNCFSKNDSVHFYCSDVLSFNYQKTDAFIISDVLHYLTEYNQSQLIVKCVENLNDGGVLIIRDGNSEMVERHKRTKLTEFFSTKVFKFNKVTIDKLCFTSKDKMVKILSDFDVVVEVLDNTKFTSNIIFLIRKK